MMLGKLCAETLKLEYVNRIIQPLTVTGPLTCDIRGVTHDSRQVRPGFLFVALPGQQQSGARFIEEAVQRGAVAVVSESNGGLRHGVTQIRVEDARRALAEIACAFHDHPARQLQLIGITGTNGKSTVSFMCRDMLRAAGRTPGLLGTIRYEIGDRQIPASRTTPEAPDIQSMLHQMVDAGCRSAVMEVSSHGLDQKRTWGLDFDVGVFTNLTQDHLDYHKTMPAYFAAKALLFRGLGQLEKQAYAAINLDDAWGQQLAGTGGLNARVLTFGLHPGAAVRAAEVTVGARGADFQAVTPWGAQRVHLSLLGRHNVSNALAALAACGALDVPLPTMVAALAGMAPVPGRLDPVPNDRGFQVFVDYAHTDDALAHVLATLRELTSRRVLVVFGCGGNRDQAKRPLMGAVVARLADYAIVTSDNPRNEAPEDIIAQVVPGFGAAQNFEIEADRERAIARALTLAQPGDIVLLAGKGHENVQELAHTIVPFDDRDIAARLLKKK
ncbi:MAG: UDP-N-acetylmuramoyl-L-alanyl-D-glutamate--2,6-diaminopimelate ligase [Kiritimatiellaeota bacterium]|nr:UDP-N-acetylmuramoyl-L-alanyl-D-glutamate--2,6-diaminopimelate ligase [Kiritimatiellota bacterium]